MNFCSLGLTILNGIKPGPSAALLELRHLPVTAGWANTAMHFFAVIFLSEKPCSVLCSVTLEGRCFAWMQLRKASLADAVWVRTLPSTGFIIFKASFVTWCLQMKQCNDFPVWHYVQH